jgi:hypothetical protein
MFNQYPQMQMPQYNQFPQMRQYGTQRQEVTRVNGEGGANAYQLMPNSSALLLDETAPIVWLVTTDGAGFKSVQPYEIKPYQPKTPVDANSLEERIARLEAKIYAQPDVTAVGANKSANEHSEAVQPIQTTDGGERPASNYYRSPQYGENDSSTV